MPIKERAVKVILVEAHTNLSNKELSDNVVAAIKAHNVNKGAVEVKQVTVHTCQPPKTDWIDGE